MMKRNKKTRKIYWLILSAMFFGLLGCKQSQKPLEIPQLVKTALVEKYGEKSAVTYPGKILSAENVKLSFRVAGPIKKVYVSAGQEVKRGDLLAELDPRDYQLQYDATQAEYNQIVGESDRVIELYRRGSVSVNEFDKAMAAKKRISALYHAHRNALNDTRLKAPFDGYIQHKYFSAPEMVNQGIPVLSLINDNCLEVEVEIPAADFVRRDDFIGFSAVADAFPNLVQPLALLDVNQGANYNQLFNVRFQLAGDVVKGLATGMSVAVTIQYKPGEEDLTIVPVTALFQEAGRSHVWVLDTNNQMIHKMAVAVQRMDKEGKVLVKSDLRSGQILIAAGVNDLKEGQKVRVLI